jgi:hypothetical protein
MTPMGRDCEAKVRKRAPTAVSGEALEHQRTVGTAEPKVVLEGVVNPHVTRRVGTIIQIAVGVLVENIDSGCKWNDW